MCRHKVCASSDWEVFFHAALFAFLFNVGSFINLVFLFNPFNQWHSLVVLRTIELPFDSAILFGAYFF